jgi:hypothetical protein
MATTGPNHIGDMMADQTKYSMPRSSTSDTFGSSELSTLIPSLDSKTSSGLDALQKQNFRESPTSTQQWNNERTSVGGSAFQSAYAKFRARLPGNQLLEFQNTTYEELCQEIVRIQHEQEKNKKMMNLSRIQACLEAMNQFGKTIEVFLNVSDAVAFVWGPIKFLLLVSIGRAHSFSISLTRVV